VLHSSEIDPYYIFSSSFSSSVKTEILFFFKKNFFLFKTKLYQNVNNFFHLLFVCAIKMKSFFFELAKKLILLISISLLFTKLYAVVVYARRKSKFVLLLSRWKLCKTWVEVYICLSLFTVFSYYCTHNPIVK
jgi:hypothetical protein